MDMFDLASQLFGGRNPSAQGSTITATGSTASADGVAGIVIDADVTPAEGTGEDTDQTVIDVPTSPSVAEGDELVVTLVGEGPLKTPIVMANPGSGDRIQVQVDNAETLAEQAEAVASATGQNFWPDTDGVHVTQVTKDEWNDSTSPNYHSGANVLLNALGQLFRDGLNNILAILSGTTPGVAIYDGLGNAADNILAEFTSSGSTIGRVTEGHVTTDTDSVTFYDGSDELFGIGPSSSGGPSINTTRNDYYVGSDRGTTPPLVSYVHGNTNSVQDYGDGSIVELHANAQYDNALKMAHVDVFSPASGNSISSESKIRLDADRIILDGSYLQPYYADQYGTVTTADVPMEQAIAALTTPITSRSDNISSMSASTDARGGALTLAAGTYLIDIDATIATSSGSGTRSLTVGIYKGGSVASYRTFGESDRAYKRIGITEVMQLTAQTSIQAYIQSSVAVSSASSIRTRAVRLS